MKKANDEGVALILALLFVVLLTAIVVEYSYETQVDSSLVSAHFKDLEAYVAAKSAVADGMGLLAADLEDEYNEGISYDSLWDQWAQSNRFERWNEAVMQLLIDDEWGKLNLNSLLDTAMGDEEAAPTFAADVLRILLELRTDDPQMADDLVDALLDWTDSDDDAREYGAEADYYTGLEIPYGCKNAPLDSVEELLLVRGFTPRIFYGDPELDQTPLTELLTVHGHPEGKINPNTAEWEVLNALGEALGGFAGLADEIVERREEDPFREVGELAGYNLPVPPGQETAQVGQSSQNVRKQAQRRQQGEESVFVVRSDVFRVRGHGIAGELLVRIDATIWRNPEGTGELFRILDWRVYR
jgi:general secretion pathway protein K